MSLDPVEQLDEYIYENNISYETVITWFRTVITEESDERQRELMKMLNEE